MSFVYRMKYLLKVLMSVSPELPQFLEENQPDGNGSASCTFPPHFGICPVRGSCLNHLRSDNGPLENWACCPPGEGWQGFHKTPGVSSGIEAVATDNEY